MPDVLDTLGLELELGRHVVIDCRMGIGRSSLVAIGLLVREGRPLGEAYRIMSEARGMEISETVGQRAGLDTVLGNW